MQDMDAKKKVLEMIMGLCDDATLDPLKKKKESMLAPSAPSDDSSSLADKLKGLSSEGSDEEEASESPMDEAKEGGDSGMDDDTIKKLIEQYAGL